MQNIRELKTDLIEILSNDAMIVLQYVHKADLITLREYRKLKDKMKNHTSEDFIIDLLDKLIGKSDKTCYQFLELLQHVDMQETFPKLTDIFTPPALRQDASATVSEYRMASFPRGVCVIFNNVHFAQPLSLTCRKGSEKDVESLQEVFQWLGFTVEVHIDKRADETRSLLKELSVREHQGDCFVCCILSHADLSSFYATDGIIKHSEILQLFMRTTCPSLADKPKVFVLNTDFNESTYPIPDSDFLLALATIPGRHSFRHVLKGSWFIQSLCKMLKKGCQSGEDILAILYQAISEVSMNETPKYSSRGRQIPHVNLTLTKRLIFPVPGPVAHALKPGI